MCFVFFLRIWLFLRVCNIIIQQCVFVCVQIVEDLICHGWAAEAAHSLHLWRITLSCSGCRQSGHCWWHQEVIQVSSRSSGPSTAYLYSVLFFISLLLLLLAVVFIRCLSAKCSTQQCGTLQLNKTKCIQGPLPMHSFSLL